MAIMLGSMFMYILALMCTHIAAFHIQATMREKLMKHILTLPLISNEGVEYVREIPVVKTFGQTVFSFKRFSKAIDDYTDWAITYTKSMTMPMVKYMTAINSVFVALVVAAYIFSTKGVSQELVLNMMYYIIITPLLTVAMTKLVYSGEQEMTLVDAIERVDKILNTESLDNEGKQEMPKDCSISFKDVSYRYANAKREALRRAQCMDIINKLPKGINTVIGEKGTYLSGGERQRISIARAFLKDAPIILLDEATASLDVENETLIQEALSSLIKNKTVIIIAHRMRTVEAADRIVVLKDGRVLENASPKELLSRKDSMFAHMREVQLQTSNWRLA